MSFIAVDTIQLSTSWPPRTVRLTNPNAAEAPENLKRETERFTNTQKQNRMDKEERTNVEKVETTLCQQVLHFTLQMASQYNAYKEASKDEILTKFSITNCYSQLMLLGKTPYQTRPDVPRACMPTIHSWEPHVVVIKSNYKKSIA